MLTVDSVVGLWVLAIHTFHFFWLKFPKKILTQMWLRVDLTSVLASAWHWLSLLPAAPHRVELVPKPGWGGRGNVIGMTGPARPGPAPPVPRGPSCPLQSPDCHQSQQNPGAGTWRHVHQPEPLTTIWLPEGPTSPWTGAWGEISF